MSFQTDESIPESANSMRRQFLCAKNIRLVINTVYAAHIERNPGNEHVVYAKLFREIPHRMYRWVARLPEPTLVFGDPLEGLAFLNNMFTAAAINFYNRPTRYDGNPYRTRVTTGTVNEDGSTLERKLTEDLTAADWHTLDVHRDETVFADASRYRNRNLIRAQEISRHVRRYDRDANDSREGYTSLENPVRGEDMRRFTMPAYSTGATGWYGKGGGKSQ